jgi:hypothetical protein
MKTQIWLRLYNIISGIRHRQLNYIKIFPITDPCKGAETKPGPILTQFVVCLSGGESV